MKTVLITGATSGYGLETAKVFKRNGYITLIASRNPEKVEKCIKEFGFDKGYTLDVTDFDGWVKLKEEVMRDYGHLDVLVNNAGAGISIVKTVDQTKENIDAIIALNLTSSIYGSKVFAPVMMDRKDGVIINISSICARHQWASWTVYGCAKAGLLSFSKGLYAELRPYGIRVSCIMPGQASTGFQRGSGIGEVVESLRAEDIANAVWYCASQPKEVVIEEITVWGISQDVQPL